MGHSLRLDGDSGSRIASASTQIALRMHGDARHCTRAGLVAGEERAHELRSAHELHMTIYPKSTECHYGGYGAERAERCLATKSTDCDIYWPEKVLVLLLDLVGERCNRARLPFTAVL